MTSVQKVIKYLALAFALFLIFSILSAIMFGVSTLSYIFSSNDSEIIEELKDINISGDNISFLDIDIKYANLIIKRGDTLKAETNNKYISCNQEANKLIIKEKKHSLLFNRDDSNLIIYIPEKFIFDGISIDSGAGKIEIEEIITKILELDLGAGKVIIDSLTVEDSAEIDGGAGEIAILSGNINNLDLNVGVGKFTLTSKLTGNSKIDAGVGKLDIILFGTIDDYRIRVDKGIGSAKLGNDDMKSGNIYGSGVNIIDIDGGIGSIDIKIQ